MLSELHSKDTPKDKTDAQIAKDKMGTRDGEIYKALSYFIIAVSIPVLTGTYFAYEAQNVHAAVVNLVCSLVLLAIGVASWFYGGVVLARHK